MDGGRNDESKATVLPLFLILWQYNKTMRNWDNLENCYSFKILKESVTMLGEKSISLWLIDFNFRIHRVNSFLSFLKNFVVGTWEN